MINIHENIGDEGRFSKEKYLAHKKEPEIKKVPEDPILETQSQQRPEAEGVIPVNPLDHSDPRTKEVASAGLSLDGSTDIQNRNIPAINSDDDFNLALDDYTRVANSEERRSILAKNIKNYRGARFFNDGVDPVFSVTDKEEAEKMNYVADLRRDWDLDPEARKRVEQKKGKAWADLYANLSEDDKELLGTYELMKAGYGGDKDNFGIARYAKAHNIPFGKDTKKLVWEDFGRRVALADNGRAEEKARSDKALKLLPQVSFSLFNGERLHDVIKTMDKDDALWYMENFGVGSRGAVGMEKAAVALNALLGGEDDRVYMSVSGGITSQEEGFPTKRLFGGDEKKNNTGKIASFVEGQEALGDPEIGPKGLDRLVSLKKESPDAYNILISTIQITADDIRNNRWDYVPGVSPASAMFFQKSNQSANWIARNISGREISKDQADVIDDITIASDITKSRDGAWGVTKMIDHLGGMTGETASFLLTRGVSTFGSVANSEYLRLKREGYGETYAQWHALPSAIGETASEFMFFGKWGKLVSGVPFLNKLPLATKTFGAIEKGATKLSLLEANIAKNTVGRFGYTTFVGGTGETFEEFASPVITYAVDKAFSLACLDTSGGMALGDIKKQWSELLDPKTAISMYLFAGMMSGAYIPAMRQDAKFLSQMPDWLQAAGVPEAKAKEIANITDFRKRIEAGALATREGFANRSKEESLRSIAEAAERLNMADPLRPDMTEVEGLMQAGKIDRMTRTEDGMWEVQPRDGREAYTLNEKQAAAYLTTQVADEDAISIVEARSLALKNALVSEMEESGKFIFEKMATPGETIETLKGLAKAAGIRMEELRSQGVANPEAQIDPSISENIPLGQIKNIRETLKDRKVIAESRGEIEAGEEGVSNAYRVRLNSAKTVIRFAEGRMNFSELLEEYYESKVSDSLNGTRTAEWWGTNLRESQKALRDMGILDADFIKADGELSRLDILEGASFLGRAVAMNEAQKSALPEGVRDFLRMLAAWTREALGLARLGKGFEVAAQKGHINKDFAREVYGLVGIQSEYWGEVAERAEAQTIESANEAAFEASASFSIRDGGISLESETTAWGKQLSEYLDGNKKENRDMRVCTTPAVLRMTGAKPHDIVITPSVINKVMSGKHMVSRESLEQIPSAISDPICIAKSDTPESIEVITELKENGNNILVAVKLNAGTEGGRQLKVNRITSLYGKESIGKFIAHPMLYWNKAKAREWFANQGLQLPTAGLPKASSGKKLLKPDDLVKWKDKNDISFSSGTAETLDSFMVRRSKNKAQQAFYDSLRKDLQSVLDDARTISATKESNAELISKIHKSLGVVRAATANMPDGVRHSIRPTVVKLEMLAEMAATGKINATKHLNDASRRKLVNEMIKSIDQEMTQLKQEAALDIEAANKERLAEKKGELNEKTEAIYKSFDYLDRTAVKKAYNERNQRIISIRKRYKNEDYIAQRIEKENAKFDKALSKHQTREEKLTSQITKLETRINSLKVGNVTNKKINEAISEQAEEVRKAWADEKADSLLAEMLSEIAGKVTAHHKKQRVQSIRDLAKAVKTKKTASGKTKKGMMSADSFRKLHEFIVPLFDEGETDLAGRRGKIEEEIKNLVDNEGTSTEEGLEQIAKKMAEMTTIAVFGNLKGKTLDQIEVAHDQLDAFIRREKSSWEAVMDERAQKRKVVGDKMIEALPTRAKQDTTHKAKIDNRRLKDWGDAATIFQSVPQMLDTLAKYKGLEEFAHDMRVKLGRAFDLMQSSDKARQRRMDQAIATITGEKSILKRNKFYKDWIKQTQTKIWIQPTETIKKTISVDEARLLASASKNVANKQESYSDEEGKLIAESLEQWEISEKERKEANEKDRKGRVGKRTIDIEYTIDKGEGNFLYMSKDNALNVIMLAEQESYRDLAERKGYKEGVLNQLRGWIGSQGLALKEVVLSEYKLQGDTLAKEYERSMGVPFPRNGNYSPGSF